MEQPTLNKRISYGIGLWLMLIFVASCTQQAKPNEEKNTDGKTLHIVSLNGTLSELVCSFGHEKDIVGTDVTSTYPASLQAKPKVGHNRNISVEGVLALKPDVIIGMDKDVKPELAAQFKTSGVKLILFKQTYDEAGTEKLIRAVGDSLYYDKAKADSLAKKLKEDLASVPKNTSGKKQKVLFIYARGTGTMMVAGEGTPVEKILEIAGAENAVKGFADFKPLTPESLVNANPDVILLFDSGLKSLGGISGLMKVQGIAQTSAGKNKKIIEMDGQLLTGFSQRLGEAAKELASKLN